MRKLILALSGLAVLLALALLFQGLFWLVMRLPGWLFAAPRGSHGWAVIAGALALIAGGVGWLIASRPTPEVRKETALAAAAALLVQPFLIVTVTIAFLMILGPDRMSEMTGLGSFLAGPYVITALLFSDIGRYLAFSVVVLGLALIGLTRLVVRRGGDALQRLAFYVLALAILPVVAFPLALSQIPYRPAVQAAPDIEMETVVRSRWPFHTVQMCQAIAGASSHQYEPLGWADDETLVYRVWRGGGYGRDTWRSQPGSPGLPLAYHLDSGAITRFRGLDGLHIETCDPAACVEPLLAEIPSYHPGRFGQALVSPAGNWIAFTAWSFDSPEDLLIALQQQ